MVDFHNFVTGAVMLFYRIIPYGRSDYFAAPWCMWIFLLFNSSIGKIAWQFISLACAYISAMIGFPKNRFYPVIAILTPPTLFVVATGQISALVSLACLILLLEVTNQQRVLIIILCIFVMSAKPSISGMPALVAMIWLIRQKKFKEFFEVTAIFFALALAYEMIMPGIINEWMFAMLGGHYEYGSPILNQLIFTNGTKIPVGISYFQAAPIWLSILAFVLFSYLFHKEGLTPRLIAVSMCIGFLFLPYYRMYDFVMFIYPIGYILQGVLRI